MIVYHGPENFEVANRILILNGVLDPKLDAQGVEVGVRYGFFSNYMLVNNKNLTMHCVDPYAPYMDIGNLEFTREQQEGIKQASKRLIGNKKVVWHYEPSVQAASDFADKALDFVFIDAAHNYENAILDIEAWYPKVRPGGMLCGHDINMDGVKKAVHEFLRAHLDLSFLATNECWFIQVK